MIAPDQLERFQRDGYLIIEDFFSADQTLKLREESFRLIREELDLQTHPMAVFKSDSDGNQRDFGASEKNRYFFDSADRIGFFFEDDAIDAEGKLCVPVERACNKIGHALHILSPEYRKFSTSAKMKQLVKSFMPVDPVICECALGG